MKTKQIKCEAATYYSPHFGKYGYHLLIDGSLSHQSDPIFATKKEAELASSQAMQAASKETKKRISYE